MPRLNIECPDTFPFSTTLPVRITDINYGGHLGNDSMLAVIHEARIQFLKHYGFSETDVAGTALIMTNAAIEFKAQAFYGDTLAIQIAVCDPTRIGFDLRYLVTNADTQQEIARASTGMAFFDYTKQKLTRMPEGFKQKVAISNL